MREHVTPERRRGTVRDLRRDNRSVLLWSLYFDQPCTRQELSQATGLSPASVSNVIRELIEEGLVAEAGAIDSDGGRPRVLLRMNRDHGYVIGVDVGETRVRVELFDLAMEERARADYPLDPREHGVTVIVDRILAGLSAVLADAGVDSSAVLGVGVGVPGVVEQGDEVLVHGQTYGWEAVPLERLLRAGTDLPLHIDNGAKTMGRAEMWFGAGRGAQHAVVCLIGSGVGATIIAHGRTHRGSTSSAGEWGHTTIMVGGRECRCGAKGCLEAYVGAEAVLDRYGRALPGQDEESALAALLDAATAGEEEAGRVLEETALYLGAGLADLINLFNPERIILGGWAGLLLGERLLPAIRDAARRHSLAHAFSETSIELGRLGPEAVALGAATLPIERFLNGASLSSADRRRSAG
ncbi:ROK family transcriptional regulator [Actinoallomurus purpureus]|uniref:ROK family transcriptional regulator n=1 Tax=Actinoallomurus purpureus TaxID=478114 RepID=UPI002091EB50|nr:ROK family transcriptional regulator [Actinoallomurus purpureus]MCO6003614.1 ROK family transcriptional regulator [Actinoallomurus purpureus]